MAVLQKLQTHPIVYCVLKISSKHSGHSLNGQRNAPRMDIIEPNAVLPCPLPLPPLLPSVLAVPLLQGIHEMLSIRRIQRASILEVGSA